MNANARFILKNSFPELNLTVYLVIAKASAPAGNAIIKYKVINAPNTTKSPGHNNLPATK